MQEPELSKVKKGKCTLSQAILFITNHQTKPSEYPAERVAKEFNLKQSDVDNVLEHFRLFAVHIPPEEGTTKKYLIDPFDSKSKNFENLLTDAQGKPESKKETPP